MAKIALVSADDSHQQHLAALIAQAANHVVQQVRAEPAQALARPGLGQGCDLLILDASTFGPDQLSQMRRLTTEHPETQCMLVAENPSAELLIWAMRAGVQCVLPWPPDAAEFRDELQRCTSHALSSGRSEGQVLSFLSCKGGAGTTFTAANLAHVLSVRHGKRVLLIDLCQQYGDAAFLVTDQTPPATVLTVCQQIDRMDAALFDTCLTHVAPDFDVLAGAGDPVKAGEIKAAHLERIIALATSLYDVVVFDIGQDINPASIVVLDHSKLIYPVLQMNLSYLRAGRRLMELCHSLGYHADRLRLVINHFDKHAPIERRTMENAFGMTIAHVLPYDPAPVRDASNQGVPLLQLTENSPIARALCDMARPLYPDFRHQRDGLLRKLFGQHNQVPAPVRA